MTGCIPDIWLSASEIAEAGLPSVPTSARSVQRMAQRDGWADRAGTVRRRGGVGGGLEYHVSVLPQEAQRALISQRAVPMVTDGARRKLEVIEEAEAVWGAGRFSKDAAVRQVAHRHDIAPATLYRWLGVVAVVPRGERLAALSRIEAVPTVSVSESVEDRLEILPSVPSDLTESQREIMTARIGLLEALEAQPVALPDLAAADGDIHALALRANGRGARLPSETTLKRWRRFRREGGDIALAPVHRPRGTEPAWLASFWRFYGLPSKPSIAWALTKLIEAEPTASHPPLRTVQRYVAGMGEIAKNRGRMGSRELRRFRPYRARSFLELEPLDVVSGDGHTFDAEVIHPNTGRAFRPEIGTVVDIATRRIVGWSVDLAENKLMVAAAMRRLCEQGIPAIFYVDRGSGYKNDELDNEMSGMLARAGITKEHSLPYNAQGKGVIEKINHTLWVVGAKGMPGYIGADMDREAKQKVHKVSRTAIRGEDGVSQPLAEWATFMAWAEAEVATYNAKPHSSLPRIRDPQTGRKRHASPDEHWAHHVENGWKPVLVDAAVLDDLWRPYAIRTVLRGLVRIGNGAYFSSALDSADMHGQQVQVGQDVHDMERVWVRDMEGQLVCVAERDANKSSYFQKSIIDEAKDKREAQQVKRIQRKEADLLANTRAGLQVYEPVRDAMPEVTPQVAARMARLGAEQPEADDPTTADVFTIPSDTASKLRLWRALQVRIDDGEALNEREEKFHRGFAQSADYRAAIRMENRFGQEKGPVNGAS